MSTILEAAAAAAEVDIDRDDFELPKWVPTCRVAALLRTIATENGYDLDNDETKGGREFLCNTTGLNERMVYRVLTEESVRTSFEKLEQIINHSNRLDLRWLSKEEGGFGDAFNGEPLEFPEPTERQLEYWRKHSEGRLRRKRRQKRELERARRHRVREKLAGVA